MRANRIGTSNPSTGWRSAFIPILLVFATLATYWPILCNGFVRLDDPVTVYQNFALTHLSAESLFSFWTTPYRDLYTPLTYSLFAAISMVARVKHHAGEPLANPFHALPFHAVSLFLHVTCVLLVNALLRRSIPGRLPAAAGALLFALHPVQVETVAWVTETNGLLCTALSLAAVLMYLRCLEVDMPLRDRRGRYAIATELFILAMLAKPLGVMVPFLAGVLYWMVSSRQRPSPYPSPSPGVPREGTGTRIPWGLAFWLILAIPFAVIARLGQSIPPSWLVVPLWLRPLVAADALTFYFSKIIFPKTLVPDYNRSPAAILHTGAAYYTWIVPVVFTHAIVVMRRRRGTAPLVAGMLWFFMALLPVLGFTPFAFQRMSTVADRYLYLPMFGVALCAAWGLSRLAIESNEKDAGQRNAARQTMTIICVIFLTILAFRTAAQCRYWHDTDALFKHTTEVIGRDPGTLEAAGH